MSLALSTALLSAFLDNLTTVLLMVPITFLLADALNIDPIPLVLIEIIASNIGGTATLIGDPPNILIAGATDLSFSDFALNLAPISALAFVVVTGMLYFVFRRRLQIAPRARERVMQLDARRSIEDMAELKRALPVLVITILAFFVHSAIGVEPATVALTGATVMLLLTRQTVEDALRGIEWPTLFFFAGLLVMVGALEETGAIKQVADAIGDDAYWWALSLGACFGGNLTLIAAAANVAAAGWPSGRGRPIGFMAFLKVGVPATLVSMLWRPGTSRCGISKGRKMSPQRIASTVRREAPLLRDDECLRDGVMQIIQTDVPALPVVDGRGRLLHHRVLIIPIVDGGRVTGIVTREDFFRALAERLLAPP